MKFVLLSFCLLFSVKTCSQEDVSKITYTAVSREINYQINITQKTIEVIPNRSATAVQRKCSKKDWKALRNTINAIKLKEIATIKAPSNKNSYDGAASAHITIVKNGNTYISNNFDHGNPPKVLQPLVNQILSLAESIDNQ